MELKDYLRILQRRWPWMVGTAVLTTGIMFSLTLSKAVPFFATIDVHFKKTPLELGYFQPEDYTYPFTEPQARYELFHHPDVLRVASESLQREKVTASPETLHGTLKVTPSSIQNTVTLRAEHQAADMPLRILRAIYQAYIEYNKTQNREAFRKALERVESSFTESSAEREALKEKLRGQIEKISRVAGVFDPDIHSQILASLILDLEKTRAGNRLELRRIEIQLGDTPEADRRAAEEEMLRHHVFTYTASGEPGAYGRRARELEIRMIELRKRYLDIHPTIRSLQKELNEIQVLVAEELRQSASNQVATLLDRKRMLEAGIALNEHILREEYGRLQSLGVQRVELDSLKKQATASEERDAKLRDRRQALLEARDKIDSMTELSIVVIKESPSAMPVPVSRRTSLPLMLVISVILGIGVGVVIEYLSSTIRSAVDVKAHLNLPTIATIPFIRDGPVSLLQAAVKSPLYEVYSKLAVFLDAMATEKRARTILFTSTKAEEGKTTVSSNVAIALAQMGRRVALVDGDIRKPQIHMLFGVDNSRGLFSILSGERSAEEELNGIMQVPDDSGIEAALQATPVEGLRILTSGPVSANPLAMLKSEAYGRTIADLASRYDFVILDSPPLLGVVDAAVLATQADLTFVVLAEGLVERSEAAQLKHALNQVNATVGGVVINKSKARSETYYYYYYQYRGYGR